MFWAFFRVYGVPRYQSSVSEAVPRCSAHLLSCAPLHDRSPALASEELLRQLPIRVHSNRTSAPAASSQQDLTRNLKNKREVGPMSRSSGTSRAPRVFSSSSSAHAPMRPFPHYGQKHPLPRWNAETCRESRRSRSDWEQKQRSSAVLIIVTFKSFQKITAPIESLSL